MNIAAGPGVAIREFPLPVGEADYLLYADMQAIGVVEAKPPPHILAEEIAEDLQTALDQFVSIALDLRGGETTPAGKKKPRRRGSAADDRQARFEWEG